MQPMLEASLPVPETSLHKAGPGSLGSTPASRSNSHDKFGLKGGSPSPFRLASQSPDMKAYFVDALEFASPATSPI